MTPTPTGRLVGTAEGRDLVLTRTFRAPIEDVWTSITESDRTARWFASWTGEAGPGRVIRYTLEFEEGRPSGDMTIDACGTWHLEARLAEDAGVTTLTFIQHMEEGAEVGSMGPGWEYYLDMLVASREGGPTPSFDDYYPAQKAYYEDQATGG